MTVIGLIFFLGSVIWAAFIIYQRIFGGIALEGWTTLMAFNLFASGLNLLTLGILGEYLWRNFDATRTRPTYIVEESHDKDHDHRK